MSEQQPGQITLAISLVWMPAVKVIAQLSSPSSGGCVQAKAGCNGLSTAAGHSRCAWATRPKILGEWRATREMARAGPYLWSCVTGGQCSLRLTEESRITIWDLGQLVSGCELLLPPVGEPLSSEQAARSDDELIKAVSSPLQSPDKRDGRRLHLSWHQACSEQALHAVESTLIIPATLSSGGCRIAWGGLPALGRHVAAASCISRQGTQHPVEGRHADTAQ
ncbi:hypothetical protein M8818_004100 [Zalaria obscura]|uniref:Uncharacterized protein n=1 Tax=Zalaria obscura TaxID=2024903 RepID=A0ACC3SDA7_9PEZI